uniref:Uncharacterized protein TCIL3000_7_1140 n=1 Tax=Trypanosoma congolense (strain IL3000) TaxID=1068625 RepID=G0UPK0_TRYCI|nr:unnamed protein product [Trypanosoma congolense IL3000]
MMGSEANFFSFPVLMASSLVYPCHFSHLVTMATLESEGLYRNLFIEL